MTHILRRALPALLATPALAQFARPIRFIVPWPPGGLNDLVARHFNDRVAQALGQSIVTDFRPGAGSRIGVAEIARAPADGSVIGMGNLGPLTIFPHLDRTPSYDVARDFAAICMFAASPLVLVVNNALPARSPAELLARPGGFNYASVGVGTAQHLIFEMLRGTQGAPPALQHVPYRGTQDSLIALMQNDVQAMFDALPSMLAPIRGGQVRAMAVTTPQRVPQLPDVPTLMELGFAVEVATWYGLVAPAALPASMQSRLYEEYTRVSQAADTQRFLAEQGLIYLPNAPGEFARRVAAESARWGQIIRANSIRLEG
ncbi:MAG: tripartite tricarboxylate transporter substrate binding protein [Alphaproteobacteria bacterium]|nr:tripartite tricarboxylate transporter substrate binding protein [Alphaproteobacteria bacterium]